MTPVELLARLRGAGIEVRADGENLRVVAPKGAMTAELAGEIRAHKAALLSFLAQAGAGGSASTAPIAPRSDRGPAPLSFSQQRLWYLDQLDPGTAVYNVPVAYWLRGDIDETVLRRCLEELVGRHEVLRARFHLTTDGPRVVTADDTDVPLTVARADDDDALRSLLAAEARRPFDLAAGPLVRALLVHQDPDRAVLLFTTHHVASDGWSQAVFESELGALYDAFHAGKPSPLPPLPVQYADYAVWQRAHLGGDVLASQLGYWTEVLAGTLPALDLPTDYARPAEQPSSGATETLAIDAATLEPLAALARAEGATVFNAMLAAYAILLHRYTGQDDIVIGSPVAGRVRPEIEGLIGCFTNTLALRIDLSGRPSFRELVRRVATVVRGAIEHQDLPFERLVEALDPARDLSRTPIFQTIFAFEDAGAVTDHGGGTAVRVDHRETVHAGVSRTDLSVWVTADRGGLSATVEYCDELFAADTVRQLLDAFAHLLGAITADPDAAIGTLPILSDSQRSHLLDEVNATAMPVPAGGFHRRFEEHARAHPDRIAVVAGDRELTYGELDRRANGLAARLSADRGEPIGVAVARTADMLVATLAAAKAGASYIPLDPGYPAERLAYVIADAGIERVVVDEAGAAVMAAVAPVTTIDPAAGEADQPPAVDIDGEDVAYVIYTSGSTGTPKGVEVPHRAVANFLATMAERPGLDQNDALLAVTTLSFDIAVLELFLPLSVGARVVIASADDTADGAALCRLLEEHQISAMQATPATWRLLLSAGWQGPGPAKRLVGGEAFPADLLAPLAANGALWNMYGPTETTVWSTCARLEPDQPIHIGAPIGNTQVYVLDREGRPVPPMVRGELYIGGAGVTLGYRNRAEMTAARFSDNPFAPGRLYATGDQAWWDREGRLRCGGRLDGQVKVRGFRVELGEIEAVLATHPAVDACAAMVREDRPGDARLVGYVVPVAGAVVTATELRAHLRTRLPDYMIVQHVVELERLPLTPAGKVDRAGLPAPDTVQRRGGEFVAPRTDAERYVAGVWTDVLGVDQVGVHDNFFDRGGHSLLSMQVIVRIDQDTGARLSPRALLLDSLEQIAARLPATS